MDETLKELEDSEVPETDEGKGAVAMKLKHNLITELTKLLFNNTSDTEGGENVRRLFNSFCEAVYQVREHRLTWVINASITMDDYLRFSDVRFAGVSTLRTWAVTLLTEKSCTLSIGASVVQTRLNRSKNKNVDNSHVYNETVIVPKRVILKPLVLHSLVKSET